MYVLPDPVGLVQQQGRKHHLQVLEQPPGLISYPALIQPANTALIARRNLVDSVDIILVVILGFVDY
jgi:hypothetical protein